MPGIMPTFGPWAPLPAAGTNSAMSAARWRRPPETRYCSSRHGGAAPLAQTVEDLGAERVLMVFPLQAIGDRLPGNGWRRSGLCGRFSPEKDRQLRLGPPAELKTVDDIALEGRERPLCQRSVGCTPCARANEGPYR